jgi:hypothetical protein
LLTWIDPFRGRTEPAAWGGWSSEQQREEIPALEAIDDVYEETDAGRKVKSTSAEIGS